MMKFLEGIILAPLSWMEIFRAYIYVWRAQVESFRSRNYNCQAWWWQHSAEVLLYMHKGRGRLKEGDTF